MTWLAPCLGSGLGNRLFQHAAAAGLAEKWNKQLCFLISRCRESPHGAIATIFRMFPDVPIVDFSESYLEFKEQPRGFYDYCPFGMNGPTEPVVLQGFRQSPLYFPTKDNHHMIIPNWDSALGGHLVRRLIEKDAGLDTPEKRTNTVSIHVRLGDYRVLSHHQIDLNKYYQTCLKKMKPGSRLHLFSDEPELCSHQFALYASQNGLSFTVAKPRSDVESLYEMSLCLGGNIVANSTFSWWGAWFAHESGSPWATFPDKWGNGMPDPTDLFPEWGTVVSV